METASLGKTQLTVSRVCLGTGRPRRRNQYSFDPLVSKAISLGINFFDTAQSYDKGASEKDLAEALKKAGAKRSDVIIATKFMYNNARPDRLRQALDVSLKRLQTDYVDLYIYHWPSQIVPLSDTIGEMHRLKEEGKIRAIGVSNWDEPEFEEYKEHGKIDVLQNCYNILWRRIENSIIDICTKNNISVTPYSPLCQGILAGKMYTAQDLPENDARSANVYVNARDRRNIYNVLSVLYNVAAKINRPPAQIALKWLLNKPAVTSIIVGARSIYQLEQNTDLFSWELPEEDLQKLNEVSSPYLDIKPHTSLWEWHSRKD